MRFCSGYRAQENAFQKKTGIRKPVIHGIRQKYCINVRYPSSSILSVGERAGKKRVGGIIGARGDSL